jgi:hypothetical protein
MTTITGHYSLLGYHGQWLSKKSCATALQTLGTALDERLHVAQRSAGRQMAGCVEVGLKCFSVEDPAGYAIVFQEVPTEFGGR